MHNTLVSILIPVYNREKIIKETITSALNQTYTNIEIIVVDNKSTDNTWSILKDISLTDTRIKIFQNDSNLGPVKNWKRCVDEASGIYGKILWSDDLISRTFIEETIIHLDNKNIGFVYTDVEINENPSKFYEEDSTKQMTHIYNSQEYIEGILLGGSYPLSPGCALFRMDDLKSSLMLDIPNKINADFKMLAIGNDLLIFLLTAIKYQKVAFVKNKLSFFRIHNDSITISSDNSKIVLHYDIAKAYFIENFYNKKEFIKKFNVLLYKHLKRYNIKTYNIKDITSFYAKNKCFKKDYSYLIIRALQRAKKKLF